MAGVTLHSHVLYGDISLHVRWTPVLLSEALLAHATRSEPWPHLELKRLKWMVTGLSSDDVFQETSLHAARNSTGVPRS